MANSIGRLAVQISADTDGLDAGLAKAQTQIDQFAKEQVASEKVATAVKERANVLKYGNAAGPPPPTIQELAGKQIAAQKQSRAVQKEINVQQHGVIGGGMMNAIGSVASLAGGPIGIAVGVATTAFTSAMYAAGKAAPGLMAKFTDAWDDLIATIGNLFIPMLKRATDDLRSIANLLAKVQGFGSSVGMASKQASFTSAQAFSEKVSVNAMESAGGGTKSLTNIYDLLEEFFTSGSLTQMSIFANLFASRIKWALDNV
jgi:hypothetical protein